LKNNISTLTDTQRSVACRKNPQATALK
jgi:hypothetical protein